MSISPREEMEQFFTELGVPFAITEDPETGELHGSTAWVVELAGCGPDAKRRPQPAARRSRSNRRR